MEAKYCICRGDNLANQQLGASTADVVLTAHAVFPPPITGMALCTECIVDAASRRVSVRRYNWSNGSPQITPWFRFVKALRPLTTPARRRGRRRPPHPAESGTTGGRFCVGPLPSLQLAEGLGLGGEVLRTARARGRDVRLV